mmetsp:Transcript_1332/g.3616  ORF Transcript_1332/g.3616 Transcript_1332/m.3616 type:complete len:250 (-) Transcript_1332:101-850(-)
MSGIGTGYDLSSTTYSPDGKVFQTEYAQKAIDNGSTVIGLRCKDGVVLAVEKLVLSKLLVEGSNKRIYNVDKHAGMATAGLAPDGRMVVNRACDEAANYKRFYGEPMPGHVLCDRVASYVHMFNLYWAFRPYGSTMLLGTYDKTGPSLHMIDPSGTSYRYFGAAVGKGRQLARNEIEKLKLSEMTCREAVVEAAKILHRVHDDETKPFEIEMTWVCDESNRVHQRVPAEVLAAAEAAAKAALEEDDMDE